MRSSLAILAQGIGLGSAARDGGRIPTDPRFEPLRLAQGATSG